MYIDTTNANDGSGRIVLNASHADTATKLAAVRTIGLTGDVTGSGIFDGSDNLSITTTVADNSHNHNIAGTQWVATTQGKKWSRICLINPTTNGVSGYGGLLHVNCTRGNVVCNATFMINASHSTGYSQIVQLNSTSYSSFQIRLVTNNFSVTYIELYDTADSIASGTNQSWQCFWVPFGYSSITTYTVFTDGSTVPSGYAVSSEKTVQVGGAIVANKVYGAVWNDYAEFRTQSEEIKPGYCVASTDNGQVHKTTKKFQACDGIVSDTFGFSIGETDECRTPLAVAGRVLAYCEGDRYSYHSGDTVCAGPDGKVVKMTREEIREWPDRIIGIVSEIPEYETWGTGNVAVNGRIWIKVK